MNEKYTFPENDAAILRNILGVKEADPLPDRIVDAYWQWKRCADRISLAPSPRDLVFIAMLCGHGKTAAGHESVPSNVGELWKRGEIATGARVETVFRNEVRAARLIAVTGIGNVRLQMDDDTEERDVPAERVFPAGKMPDQLKPKAAAA